MGQRRTRCRRAAYVSRFTSGAPGGAGVSDRILRGKSLWVATGGTMPRGGIHRAPSSCLRRQIHITPDGFRANYRPSLHTSPSDRSTFRGSTLPFPRASMYEEASAAFFCPADRRSTSSGSCDFAVTRASSAGRILAMYMHRNSKKRESLHNVIDVANNMQPNFLKFRNFVFCALST